MKKRGEELGKKYGGQMKKDLTNQKFGKLIALYPIGKTSQRK
jgi:hypothetical protein